MSFKAALTNAWYYVRFYYLAYLTKRFKGTQANPVGKPGYTLVFEEDFTSPINWDQWYWCEAWGCKRDNVIFKKEQVSQSASNAVLTSDLNDVQGEPPVKSGGLYSWPFLNVRYGYFESRWKLTPSGIKYWPAYWFCSSDSWPPEIDVFELMGKDSSYFTVTLHWRNVTKNKKEIQKVYDQITAAYGYAPTDFDDTIKYLQQPEWTRQKQDFIDTLMELGFHEQKGRQLKFPGKDFLAKDYHTWACDWTDKKVVWYLDGVAVYVLDKNVPNRNMFVLLTHNYTYNKKEGPKPADLPMNVYCDYFRAYEKD